VDGGSVKDNFWGVRKDVLLHIVDEPVAPGDYILNHVGFAIRRIPPEAVTDTLALYELLLRGDVDDLMSADVRAEIKGTACTSCSSAIRSWRGRWPRRSNVSPASWDARPP